MEVLIFLVFAAIFAVAMASAQAVKVGQSRELSTFMRSLEGGRGRTEQGWFEGLSSTWVKGTLEGRPVSLDFQQRGGGKSKNTVAIYGVEVDNAAADFDLSKANLLDRLGSFFGLVQAPKVHKALGTNVVVRGGSSSASRGLLQQGELATKLSDLIDADFTSVKLSDGRLVVEQRVGVGGATLGLSQLKAVYRRLFEVAALCERRKVTVKVKGLSVKPRFAWTAGGKGSLCPYCRDEVLLDGEGDDDLTACDRCSTLHHRACFDEAGGCTIFGCGQRDARVAERA